MTLLTIIRVPRVSDELAAREYFKQLVQIVVNMEPRRSRVRFEKAPLWAQWVTESGQGLCALTGGTWLPTTGVKLKIDTAYGAKWQGHGCHGIHLHILERFSKLVPFWARGRWQCEHTGEWHPLHPLADVRVGYYAQRDAEARAEHE